MQGIYEGDFYYFGKESVTSFLGRIVKLGNLKSNDPRFDTMADDIWQHTEMNDDWDNDWIFTDSRLNLLYDEELFKSFLEQLFHPAVRDNNSKWQDYLNIINKILIHDNLQLMASESDYGRFQYVLTEVENTHLIINYGEKIKKEFNSEYIDSTVAFMIENIDSNPNVAIGRAKELMESCAKTILEELDPEFDEKLEFTPLLKKAMEALNLSANNQNKNSEAGKIAAKLLGNLGAVSQQMAELRNIFGTGHGKSKRFVQLPSRYARLTVGTSVTLVNFLWETYEDRKTSF